jgi:hypothetical protein
MRRPRFLLFALLAFLAAAPLLAAGYTIFLKDGSRLIAKQKYKVQNGRAIITLPNGTQTFVQASQIDVKRTEEYNRAGYGGAVVLPGTSQDVGRPPGEPPKDKTLADLIATKEAAPRDLPGTRRETSAPPPGGLVKTRAGFPDLTTLPRKPFASAEVAAQVQQFFRGQGIDEVEVYEGTEANQPLVEVTASSEGSVFKALATAANSLLDVRDAFPQRVAAFQVLLTTPERERAGQFVLTPEMAADLVAKKLDVTAFFIRNVQF